MKQREPKQPIAVLRGGPEDARFFFVRKITSHLDMIQPEVGQVKLLKGTRTAEVNGTALVHHYVLAESSRGLGVYDFKDSESKKYGGLPG